MPLQLTCDETIKRVKALAERTGESPEEAIDHAVEEKLVRLGRKVGSSSNEDYVQRVLASARAIAADLQPDSRSMDEIIGYDEHGLPN
jgi:antitoxin VapB